MALSAEQRERYARHLLLAEIGDAQQQALCDSRVVFAPGADPAVVRTAALYLTRAGVAEVREGHGAASGAQLRTAASRQDVQRLAGDPALQPAAAALLGAFEAVEALKQCTGLGTPALFPPELTLSQEEP